jgi:YVTN family beta-propeller protein
MSLAAALVSVGPAWAASRRIVRTKAEWQAAIAKVRAPGAGCYHASYPALHWQAVTCAVAPKWPVAPTPPAESARRAAPAVVGAAIDYAARVSGVISQATGSFQDVSPKITEKGKEDNEGPEVANAFSLQLNTEFFASPRCSAGRDPSGCQGWQQFLYANEGGTGYVFMQYWLIDYGGKCPADWIPYSSDCYTNSPSGVVTGGPLTAKELASVKLSGSATSGGHDEVSLSVGSGKATLVTNNDSMLDLSAAWNTTEWGVLGDAGGGEAYFGTHTTLEARTTLTATRSSAPVCVREGFTASCAVAAGKAPSPVAYVVNGSSGTVTPISTATNSPGKPVRVGSLPHQIAITPNGRTAYVVNDISNTVTPITTATNTAGKAIHVGDDPTQVLIAPNGKTAYVLNYESSSITPIATGSDTPGKPIPAGDEPESMAMTPNGKTIYVTDLGLNAVTPIATATDRPGARIELPVSPWYIAITPNGKTAYVSSDSDAVIPIALTDNTPEKTITAGSGTSLMTITPNGKTVYVENGGAGTVTPIAISGNKPGKAIRFATKPPKNEILDYPIASAPNSQTVYALNAGSDTIVPISATANIAGKVIVVGKEPVAIAFTPNGKTAYVVNASSGTVTPIAVATNKPGRAIPVGSGPDGIAITP